MSEPKYSINNDRPITGDVRKSARHPVQQIDSTEFLARIDRILALPDVAGVIWEQYTPYFNDGEPCVFSVDEPRIIFQSHIKPDKYSDILEYVQENEGEEGKNKFFKGEWRDYSVGYTASELWTREDKDWSKVYSGGWGERSLNKDAVGFISKKGFDLEPYYDAMVGLGDGEEWEAVALENFGDHALVIATREGFHVEEYEHE